MGSCLRNQLGLGREMAQWLGATVHQVEDLSLYPRNQHGHECLYPRTEEVETGRS